MDQLRKTSREREYLLMDYKDAKEEVTQRELRPLAIYFWKGLWTLLAWCELRNDFRNFREDRITGLTPQRRNFSLTPGQEMHDYIALMEAERGRPG